MGPATAPTPNPQASSALPPLDADKILSRSIYAVTILLWLVISATVFTTKWMTHYFSNSETAALTPSQWIPTFIVCFGIGAVLFFLAWLAGRFIKHYRIIAAAVAVLCVMWIAYRALTGH